MKSDSRKDAVIVLRTTTEKKNYHRKNAESIGSSLTDYFLNKAEEHIIVSPLCGRQMVKVLHSLYLQLLQIESRQVDTREIQSILSEYARLLRDHMNMLKNSN
ncbi:hypothetical protein [Sporomusa sp.]|uniref:hypothetical protein n=1 Tax=Sporomusa sp. TaxID=2078658 RepID=UPI002C31EA04|nr:hypothetical protein [Sporomusa sp.]HWR42271.1 hypothetical protein [Sporomusa sp.]